jgi:hypothetical protein
LEGRKFHRFVKLVLKGLCVCKIMERIVAEIGNAIRQPDTTGVRCEASASHTLQHVRRDVSYHVRRI